MNKIRWIFLLLALGAVSGAGERPAKKLICFGWMVPRTLAQFQVPVEQLEKDVPFDGIGMRPLIDIRRDGRKIEYNAGTNKSTSPIRLEKADFSAWIDAFSKLKFTRLKHNFIMVTSAQFSPDWFDDATWAKTLNNHRVLTWFARRIGFEGLNLDTEAYKSTDSPFVYRAQSGHSFAETEKKVCERGREWIRAVSGEYPGMTLFAFIWASDCLNAYLADHQEDLKTQSLALQRAFMNGVYDAAPDTLKIVDGNEDPGYHAATTADFSKVVSDYHRFPKYWIDRKNLDRYFRITSMGFSLYLDSYVKNPGPYNIWSKTKNPSRLLQENIARALDHADEYAWVWGEKGTFWPQLAPGHRYGAWNKKLPYAREAIAAGRDPYGTAGRYAGKENLLKNGELEAGTPADTKTNPGTAASGIAQWSAWQQEGSARGVIAPDNGAAKFTGVGNGSITQSIMDFVPDDRFLLTARAKTEGEWQIPQLAYFFRDAGGKGLWRRRGVAAFGPPDAGGWRHAELLIDIPSDVEVTSLTVGCGVEGPRYGVPKESVCWFDDVKLRRVVYPWW